MTVNELKSKQGVVIDSNLFLLYCVGYTDSYKISTFTRRLSRYTVGDYNLLREFIIVARDKLQLRLVITPHILTEVVNLIGVKDDQFRPVLGSMSTAVAIFEELSIPSFPLLKLPGFPKFGLTDMGLYTVAQEGYAVLTDDENVRSFLIGNGCSAMNFNELKVLLPQKKSVHHRKY
jgi:hypothetical protein